MPRNPPSAPARFEEGWHAIVVAAGGLLLVELARGELGVGARVFGSIGRVGAGLSMGLGLLVVVALHHGVVWSLLHSVHRRLGTLRVAFSGSLALALVYGFFWQETVTSGDGVAASRWGTVLRVGLGVGVPLGLAAVVALIFWPGRIPRLARTLVLCALLLAGFAVTLWVLPQYGAFHGFLGGFEATVAALLVFGRRATRPLSFALAGLGLVALLVLAPRAFAAQAYARRFTHLPGTMLEALPVTHVLLPAVSPFVDPDARPATPRRRAPAATTPVARRGDSVLLVVLEATRSDVWADPVVAPEFAAWKSHGIYVPRAVSQYPATPLAYGAIFTSQPPSVVVQSPHWTKHHLFDLLAPGFSGVFLSQPRERWFDTGAMTSFISGKSLPIRRHTDSHQGIAELKSFLEGDAGKQPFFAWIHLFDPHRPHDARGGLSPKASRFERYKSEVKAMDAELGAFMRWF